jgi:hypothetical protein
MVIKSGVLILGEIINYTNTILMKILGHKRNEI